METESMKELREIKKAMAAGFRNVREFFEDLMRWQNETHPEFAAHSLQPA